MGEAKRRKQLDAGYGSVPSLNNSNQRQKHVSHLIEQIEGQFAPEIKQIASAESFLDTYDDYRAKVFTWLDTELKNYRVSDRTMLASSIMTFYAEIAMKYEASPLLLKFWYEVLESFLPSDKQNRIKTIVEKIEQGGFSK